MKILILDDSKTMLRIISNTLKSLGYTDITTGLDGEEGLIAFNSNKFDLIITDWNMPNMNGLEFICAVRKLDKEIPIIMVTTEGGKKEVIIALKAGVNNYIVKSFTPAVLKEKLEVFTNTITL